MPSREFYDILKVGDDYWLAGEGLWRSGPRGTEGVRPSGRYTALVREPAARAVWFAGEGGVGFVDPETGASAVVPVDAGYIWELVARPGRIWYFGSEGYGWIETGTTAPGAQWRMKFTPRPCVSDFGYTDGRLFIGSAEGLFRITEQGHSLVLAAKQVDNQIVCWVVGGSGRLILGTKAAQYQWSGEGDPVRVDSSYGAFFNDGIGNASAMGELLAIAEYPEGVVIWDPRQARAESLVRPEGGLRIGDVFKVRTTGAGELAVLGTQGVGVVRTSVAGRFFPKYSTGEDTSYRGGLPAGIQVHLLYGDEVVVISDNGLFTMPLEVSSNWISIEPDGDVALGAVISYQILYGGTLQRSRLSEPVYKVLWGERTGYATGADGLYTLDEDLQLKLVYRTAKRLEMLGELGGAMYLLDGEGVIEEARPAGESWQAGPTGWRVKGALRKAAAAAGGIGIATDAGLWLLDGAGLRALPLEPGWEVRGLGAAGDRLYAALFNAATGELGVALYKGGVTRMLQVPHLDKVGTPVDLVCGETRLALVGSAGVAWHRIEDIAEVAQPHVDIDLLLDDRRIEDRTIEYGMHFIDLRVDFKDAGIPALVQYRINEERWRTVNLLDPSLQFAGHGRFAVELRAVHPNGNTSPSRIVQFGIAPPWYLDPRYQGGMVVAAMLAVWGLYHLRTRQVKRRNLWLQEEVRKRTRELEAAKAAQANFLAGISHDIRNPLNGVLMIAEALSRRPPRTPDDQRLRDLTDYGMIVDRMLGEVLDFSAIDQQGVSTSLAPVPVRDIIESSVKQNQFGLQRGMVTLETAIAPELRDVVIRTDRNWMIKVLSNLIINALDYSGTDRIEVGATCHELTDTEAVISVHVADWGRGIHDSEKELVFERFYRGESGIESGKHGTGLGLSICRDIAHKMGGELTVEDNQPSGCRFVLKGRFERVEGAGELDTDAVMASLKGRRVLVVDDLDYNRRAVVDFFETIGCVCDEAGDGHEALDRLERNRYHLALLDWDLPGLTGPEIARRHRRQAPDDPVLMISVTAYSDGEKKRESEEAGMNGYISKPLTASRLAHCLASISQTQPLRDSRSDAVNADELREEIYKHIDDCARLAAEFEYESLRRCAHRLTTLALMRNIPEMQRVCRDLQVAAQQRDATGAHACVAALGKWKRP